MTLIEERTKKEEQKFKNKSFSFKGIGSKKYLQDLKVCTKDKIENKKFISELTDEDQISIVSDVMFKTMLGNSNRKNYPCKLLSGLLENTYEELMENSEYYKNEFDKDKKEDKSQKGDLILKIGKDYINVEMNLRNEINRNIEYADRLYRSKIKIGSEYIYSKVLSVNLNNFYFEGHDKIIDIYHTQNDEGVLLDNKTSIQIYLPKLIKKWYTEGTKRMSELEKTILVMVLPNRKEAQELAEGDEILEKYVEEVKTVEKDDEFLKESYDHELSGKLAALKSGYDEGYYDGIKEVITNMLMEGMKVEEIHNCTNIPLDTINKIKKEVDKTT